MPKGLKPIHESVLAFFQAQTTVSIDEGAAYQILRYKI